MEQGFTWLKQDFGINLPEGRAGRAQQAAGHASGRRNASCTPSPASRSTEKGVAWLSDWVGGDPRGDRAEVPLASDHFGHIDVNSCIRLAQRDGEAQPGLDGGHGALAARHLLKQIKDATDTPILTGEDIYLKEDFIKLVDMGAVDMIHPDLASAGGLLETKKIGDYAMEHGVAMAMHFAGTPISFMANVHCAAATENFIALEHHSVDVPWWEDLVTGPTSRSTTTASRRRPSAPDSESSWSRRW